MGLNHYYTSALSYKKTMKNPPGSRDLIFVDDEDENKNMAHNFCYPSSLIEVKRFFHEIFCRELVCAYSHEVFNYVLREVDGRDGIVGFRCFGEVHSDVAAYLLKNPSRISALEKAFKNVLGFTIEIRAGIYNGNTKSDIFPKYPEISHRDMNGLKVTKSVRGYVDAIFYSKDYKTFAPPKSMMSLVLGMLRELSVVRGMVNGSIKDWYSLGKRYINLGNARYLKKDISYIPVQMVNNYTAKNMKQITEEVKEKLATPNNGDGSDYFSMLCTGFYIFLYYTNSPKNVYESGSGPVNSVLFTNIESVRVMAENLFANHPSDLEFLKLAVTRIKDSPSREYSQAGLRHLIGKFL
jgi:hypothetical protein